MLTEEERLWLLRDIEFAIKSYYHYHPDLTDAEVREALSELVRMYTALYRGSKYRSRELSKNAFEIAEMEKALIESRRDSRDLSLEDALDALKTIRASVKRHMEKSNPRAYLEFIDEFVI